MKNLNTFGSRFNKKLSFLFPFLNAEYAYARDLLSMCYKSLCNLDAAIDFPDNVCEFTKGSS